MEFKMEKDTDKWECSVALMMKVKDAANYVGVNIFVRRGGNEISILSKQKGKYTEHKREKNRSGRKNFAIKTQKW
jgi:hypothetical protein